MEQCAAGRFLHNAYFNQKLTRTVPVFFETTDGNVRVSDEGCVQERAEETPGSGNAVVARLPGFTLALFALAAASLFALPASAMIRAALTAGRASLT